MSAVMEPGGDNAEPSVVEFLSLWFQLQTWQRGQLLSHYGLPSNLVDPVSALLKVASVDELVEDAQSVFELGSDDLGERAGAGHPSERHVVLEWPPRGRLALIREAMRAQP